MTQNCPSAGRLSLDARLSAAASGKRASSEQRSQKHLSLTTVFLCLLHGPTFRRRAMRACPAISSLNEAMLKLEKMTAMSASSNAKAKVGAASLKEQMRASVLYPPLHQLANFRKAAVDSEFPTATGKDSCYVLSHLCVRISITGDCPRPSTLRAYRSLGSVCSGPLLIQRDCS